VVEFSLTYKNNFHKLLFRKSIFFQKCVDRRMTATIPKAQMGNEDVDTIIKSTGPCGGEIKIKASAGGMVLTEGNYHDIRYIYR
jgi:hypothetical protein